MLKSVKNQSLLLDVPRKLKQVDAVGSLPTGSFFLMAKKPRITLPKVSPSSLEKKDQLIRLSAAVDQEALKRKQNARMAVKLAISPKTKYWGQKKHHFVQKLTYLIIGDFHATYRKRRHQIRESQ
uniref:Uncharacterized protein n=1 Tax=Romanomermis culicivorax TaxID=13658 RepID=A0A915K7S7_ROMCU